MGIGRFFCYEMAMTLNIDPTSPRFIVAAAALFEASATMKILTEAGVPFTFIEVGIGAIKSAHIAARTTELVRGRPILFLGSCGTSQFSECQLVTAKSVAWAPADVRHGESYLIPGIEPLITLDAIQANTMRICDISCSSSITSRAEKKPDIYENLELYSTASAWRSVAGMFWSILGVTNQLGPNAHAQWKKHHGDVAHMTATFLKTHLDLFFKA